MQVERNPLALVLKNLVANGWVTRENLPLGEVQQLETTANTTYYRKVKEAILLGRGSRLISLLVW